MLCRIIYPTFLSFPSSTVKLSLKDWNSWPLIIMVYVFLLKVDKDCSAGARGVSNEVKTSETMNDYLTKKPLNKLSIRVGWVQSSKCLVYADAVNSNSTVFAELHWSNST